MKLFIVLCVVASCLAAPGRRDRYGGGYGQPGYGGQPGFGGGFGGQQGFNGGYGGQQGFNGGFGGPGLFIYFTLLSKDLNTTIGDVLSSILLNFQISILKSCVFLYCSCR